MSAAPAAPSRGATPEPDAAAAPAEAKAGTGRPARTEGRWPRRTGIAGAWRRVAGWWHFAVAALISLAAALWTFRPWEFGSSAMFPNGDALGVLAWAQNSIETGWYENGDRLAAPFAQNVHPFTVTDDLVFAIIKMLAPITGSAPAAVQWWAILTFPAAALTAVLLARHLGISKVSSMLVGTAFALHIDHFVRSMAHYQLAGTWVIPIGVLAAVSLIHRPRHTGRRRVAWEVALCVGLVATGLTSAYYAVFSGVLIAAAGLAAVWLRRSWRDLALTAGRGAALAVPVVVGIILDKAYLPTRMGYEAISVTRGLADSEYYGGKITAMLLPSSFHRIPALRQLRHTYDVTFPPPGEGPSLGIVASVGFIGLVIWAVLHYWKPLQLAAEPVLATLAALTWVSLFVYVIGGFGTVWALLLHGGGVRVWSRMHIFIALLALLVVALVIDKLRPHWRAVTAVAVMCVAILDGTSPVFRPNPTTSLALETEMRAVTDQIAAEAGPDAAVFQYPAITFPVQNRDTNPGSPYDGFIPYLYSDGLRWSYGGMQGDPAADWQQELADVPLVDQLELLRAGGFAGVLLDTTVLANYPDELAGFLDALGEPSITSVSGRWLYFTLDGDPSQCSPHVAEIARDLAVRPVLMYPGDGMRRLPLASANAEGDGVVRLVTLRDAGWQGVTATFTLDTAAALRVEFPDGSRQELQPGIHHIRWTGDIDGEDAIRIVRTGPGGGDYAVTEMDADVARPADVRECLNSLEQD